MAELTHVDDAGRARMVDVGAKPAQRRLARARGRIYLRSETVALIRQDALRKGDALAVAQIAGIQAAKRTAELIPLCHPLPLDRIDVTLTVEDDGVVAEAAVACVGKTGVEIEALTAVSVALLAVYDMCKAVDRNMEIGPVRLLEKVKLDGAWRSRGLGEHLD